ncbi:GyrI-like domain-containing protein [Microbacterium trichothecenolyticum]|uniref:GyrI-like domain-containing protein n=1 Tax=Microbacterium trichothecenolyticum TaxID=69370 RepID=UPI001C6E60F2|nr:GyrI-like domain-containing protein [Microbacterium trichothecenolyticum]MBW9121838.1 GyrI-like domain-containing protein [Microbacterium trichothecenolyticum]
MTKLDLKKSIAAYTAPRGSFEIVDVPPMRYLMIDGHGDPNTSDEYGEAVAAVFGVAYKLKFLSKGELDRDYVVMPLEGLWWSDDMATFTSERDKSRWSWTMMSLVPEWLDDAHVNRARETASARGGSPAIGRLRLAELAEGRCVQTLHIGSYDDEAPVLAEMHERVIPAAGLRMRGLHHEIYLADPRRTAPEKLRTILRQPVEAAG